MSKCVDRVKNRYGSLTSSGMLNPVVGAVSGHEPAPSTKMLKSTKNDVGDKDVNHKRAYPVVTQLPRLNRLNIKADRTYR